MLRNWLGLEENQTRDISQVSEVESIRKPLIEEVRGAIATLEKFSLYSKFWEESIRLVREVNHYIDREEQKTRKQLNITDTFKKTV